MSGFPIDLGSDHHAHFNGWWPDRELNPQYEGIPDVERFGISIEHPKHGSPGERCVGAVTFDTEAARQLGVKDSQRWTVVSMEPLHIEPSVLCGCGDHGWIRDGRWVPA